jgi:hypothetical protein
MLLNSMIVLCIAAWGFADCLQKTLHFAGTLMFQIYEPVAD